MSVMGFDHVAIPTADSERFLEFYKRLGFKILREEEWRQGKSAIFMVQVGPNNIINVHPAGFVAHLRGEGAEPGCGDLCFVWEGTVEEVVEMLEGAGAQVLEGPVKRRGGRGAGAVPSQSVYIRDPDGNGIELSYELPRSEWGRTADIFMGGGFTEKGRFPGPWDEALAKDTAAAR